jgi:hypothetical protein
MFGIWVTKRLPPVMCYPERGGSILCFLRSLLGSLAPRFGSALASFRSPRTHCVFLALVTRLPANYLLKGGHR